MRTESCPFCGTEKSASADESGNVMPCADCIGPLLSFEEAEQRQIEHASDVANKIGAYTAAEIGRIRERWKLSQEQFGKALGVGKKTFGRWERGTVPPIGAANSLLFIADKQPTAFVALARRNGVAVVAPEDAWSAALIYHLAAVRVDATPRVVLPFATERSARPLSIRLDAYHGESTQPANSAASRRFDFDAGTPWLAGTQQ